jgi:hypothetical protein
MRSFRVTLHTFFGRLFFPRFAHHGLALVIILKIFSRDVLAHGIFGGCAFGSRCNVGRDWRGRSRGRASWLTGCLERSAWLLGYTVASRSDILMLWEAALSAMMKRAGRLQAGGGLRSRGLISILLGCLWRGLDLTVPLIESPLDKCTLTTNMPDDRAGRKYSAGVNQ